MHIINVIECVSCDETKKVAKRVEFGCDFKLFQYKNCWIPDQSIHSGHPSEFF